MSRKMIKRRKFYGRRKAHRMWWLMMLGQHYPVVEDTEPWMELYG